MPSRRNTPESIMIGSDGDSLKVPMISSSEMLEVVEADEARHYVQSPFSPSPPPVEDSKPQWHLVPVILVVSLGSHATMAALPPAEPYLAKAGLSPLVYSFIQIMPAFGQVLTPALWGQAYASHTRLCLLVAPLALWLGQLHVAGGIMATGHVPLWLSRSALALGMLSISISKAGLGVLQHACLAQALPCARGAHSGHGTSSLISGICVTIATTHVVGAATNATVPRIIERYGIVGLQLALLLPSAVGVLSGIALGLWLPQPQPPTPPESPEVSRRGTGSAPFEVNCTTCGRRIRLPTPWKTTCDKCRLIAAISRRQRAAVLALGLWRALLVGSLHALKMITLALLVAHGITAENAGGLLALTNTVSLLLLPLLPLLSSRGNGLVHALLLLSLATLACMIGLVLSEELLGEDASWSARVHPLAPQGGRDHRLDDTYGDDDALPLDTRAALGGLRPINGLTLAWLLPRLSVFGFAVCGTLAPVVPLALVPQVNGVDASVGAAYGRLEMIFSGTQALIVLAVGAARQHGGFKLALRVLTTTMVLSIPITLLAMRLTTAAIVATRDKKGNL